MPSLSSDQFGGSLWDDPSLDYAFDEPAQQPEKSTVSSAAPPMGRYKAPFDKVQRAAKQLNRPDPYDMYVLNHDAAMALPRGLMENRAHRAKDPYEREHFGALVAEQDRAGSGTTGTMSKYNPVESVETEGLPYRPVKGRGRRSNAREWSDLRGSSIRPA